MKRALHNQQHTTPRLFHNLGKRIIKSAAIGLFGLWASSVYAINLPDLGAPDLIEYDQATEEKLGHAFTAALHTQYSLNYDPEVVDYIRQIGDKVTRVIGDNRHFAFYVIDNPDINAFAGPNGVIGIHTGLINAVESEDELASVIAHEIAHITQRHLSRRYEYQSSTGNISSIASLIAAILVGMHDPSAGMATLMGGMGLNIEQQLKNSRQHETEADQYGIEFLHKAGFNPHAMADFFGRLDKASQFNSFAVPEILRTHPITEGRLAQAQNRAEALPPFIAPKPNNNLQLIKLRVQNSPLKNQFSHNSLHSLQTSMQDSATKCYQDTLNSIKSTQSKGANNAAECITQIAYAHPEQPLYANLLFEKISQQPEHFKTSMRKHLEFAAYLHEIHPQNLASLIRYSDLLAQNNQMTAAIEVLLKNASQSANPYSSYDKVAQYYQQQQKYSHAYYYSALAHADIGNFKRAVYLLSQAKIEIQKRTTPENTWLANEITKYETANSNLLKSQDKEE